jgi:hypothetical protein
MILRIVPQQRIIREKSVLIRLRNPMLGQKKGEK